VTTRTYAVTGLTCDHCAHAVRTEVGALPGVAAVEVDLVPGGASAVTVTSDRPLADTDLAGALDEAGDYALAPGS
jgi:copper chaperone CopZ